MNNEYASNVIDLMLFSAVCGVKVEREEKLGEFVASRAPLESENCSLESQIGTPITELGHGGGGNENGTLQADWEKEIGRLKELTEVEKGRADSERKKAAEACKLLENEKNKVVEKEKTISRRWTLKMFFR